jgi:Holliday junction DNA helicase RuvA
MIGYIQGEVLFSDGYETMLLAGTGIGYQVYCNQVMAEGSMASLYISHVIKEAAQDLYGFRSLREKKMFELLTSVKGVGPKSAYSLVCVIGVNDIIDAITFENKKVITKAPGVGAKAAAQMILDLTGKVSKIKMYSNAQKIYKKNDENIVATADLQTSMFEEIVIEEKPIDHTNDQQILTDALMACKELGFKEDNIIPVAQKILGENMISKPEQLIHLVLKEM